MKYQIIATCKCGLNNYTKEDWISHWKHGLSIDKYDIPLLAKAPKWLYPYPKLRAIYFFLTTKITIKRR
jgi:hypothetical protein